MPAAAACAGPVRRRRSEGLAAGERVDGGGVDDHVGLSHHSVALQAITESAVLRHGVYSTPGANSDARAGLLRPFKDTPGSTFPIRNGSEGLQISSEAVRTSKNGGFTAIRT